MFIVYLQSLLKMGNLDRIAHFKVIYLFIIQKKKPSEVPDLTMKNDMQWFM